MINPDYPIEALEILLQEECLSERYHCLIPFRGALIASLRALGCATKKDVSGLSDATLAGILPDEPSAKLFRRFLSMYDPKPQKFKEIVTLTADPAEREAFGELYYLPGVRFTRANLYYHSGYRKLSDFSEASVADVLSRTAETIAKENLSCIVPLPKEIRTHIAVSKAFCL